MTAVSARHARRLAPLVPALLLAGCALHPKPTPAMGDLVQRLQAQPVAGSQEQTTTANPAATSQVSPGHWEGDGTQASYQQPSNQYVPVQSYSQPRAAVAKTVCSLQ